jgi:hypothetical protein
MKYMLLMHAPLEGVEPIFTWPAEDIKAHIQFMNDLNEELTKSGELAGGEGLAMPDQARIVRATPGGAAAITDGPFPESKEFLVGFWIVDVDTPERAVEIAAKASAAPGPDGVPLNMPLEVRQVMDAPPADM